MPQIKRITSLRCWLCGKSRKMDGVSLHELPKKDRLNLLKWLFICKISPEMVSRSKRICSEHFTKSDYKTSLGKNLKDGAYPTVNIPEIPARGKRIKSNAKKNEKGKNSKLPVLTDESVPGVQISTASHKISDAVISKDSSINKQSLRNGMSSVERNTREPTVQSSTSTDNKSYAEVSKRLSTTQKPLRTCKVPVNVDRRGPFVHCPISTKNLSDLASGEQHPMNGSLFANRSSHLQTDPSGRVVRQYSAANNTNEKEPGVSNENDVLSYWKANDKRKSAEIIQLQRLTSNLRAQISNQKQVINELLHKLSNNSQV